MHHGVFVCFFSGTKYLLHKAAGISAPVTEMHDHKGEVLKDEYGNVKYCKAEKDHYDNARGNQYDLAVDGAFDGQTILVLQLYHEPHFDFELPKTALKEKGVFSVSVRWDPTFCRSTEKRP